jgi:hypothetical protein
MATTAIQQQLMVTMHPSPNPPLDGNPIHRRMEMANLLEEEIMGEVQRLAVPRLTIAKLATSGLHPAVI